MKWLHNLLKGFSLTGALFVFHACYGISMPPLYEEGGQAPMSFSLVSHTDGTPLEGIKVMEHSVYNDYELGVTGADGKCRVTLNYWRNQPGPNLRFMDPEGSYAVKDTSLTDLRDREIVVKLDRVQ